MVGSGLLLLVSSALIVPGVLGVARALTDRGRRIGRAAAVLAVLGCMGHAALAALYLTWAELPGAGSPAPLIAAIDRIVKASSFAMIAPLVIAFPLALVTVFIAVVRARIVPRWVLVPVLAAPVAASTSTAISLALLLTATCVLAARVLRAPAAVPGVPGSAVAPA